MTVQYRTICGKETRLQPEQRLHDFEQMVMFEQQLSWAKDELNAKPEVTPAFMAELRGRPEIIKNYPDLEVLVEYMKWVRAYKSCANYEINGHLQSQVIIGNYSFTHILELLTDPYCCARFLPPIVLSNLCTTGLSCRRCSYGGYSIHCFISGKIFP